MMVPRLEALKRATKDLAAFLVLFLILLFIALFLPMKAYPAPLEDTPSSSPCLNCAPPSADLLGGAATVWVPNGGWIVRPFAQITGETPITLGKGDSSKTYFRAFSDVTIGTRTSDDTVSVDSAELGNVAAWTGVEGILGLSTVVGSSADENVLTSLYVAAGGKIAIDQDSTAMPRVARVLEAGVRVQVQSAKADVRLGIGRDEEGLPESPVANPDGSIQRSLQAIISARLPIVGTGSAAWVWARGSIPILETEGSRPVVAVGLAVSPVAILARFTR